MREAAAVGEMFGQDPAALLEESSTLRRLVRLAAFNIVQGERNKQAAKG